MSFPAKYPNTCPVCENKFNVGDPIARTKDNKYGHEACVIKSKKNNVLTYSNAGKSFEQILSELKFTPSDRQLAIFRDMYQGEGNTVVWAGPGSGKTTTGVASLFFAPHSIRVAFVAFNVHIVEEIKPRVPEGVDVMTLHGMGLRNLTNAFGRVRVDKEDYKMEGILDRYMPYPPDYADKSVKREIFLKRLAMKRLVEKAKFTLVDADDPDAVQEMVYHFSLDLGEYEDETILLLPEILKWDKSDTRQVSFSDMLWMPIVWNLDLNKYDLIIVDELQDLNPAQQELVYRSLAKGGRAFGIGDKRQSMYGFTGADVRGMDTFREKLDAKVLPLDITYRMPRSHVAYINPLYPELKAAPNAIEGIIGTVSNKFFLDNVKVGDLAICRTNAPLVQMALKLIQNKKPAVVRGREEVGKGLINLAKKLNATTMEEMYKNLDEYRQTETNRLTVKRAPESQFETLNDRIATLTAMMDESKTPEDVEKNFEKLFDDNKQGVIVLSSIHKAKGLEADTVWVLQPEIMPLRTNQDWEAEQEMNIQIVAESRSKNAMYFVPKENKDGSATTFENRDGHRQSESLELQNS